MRPSNSTISKVRHHHPINNGLATYSESDRISIRPETSVSHWLFDPKSLPDIYHKVIGAATSNFGLDSSVIFEVFLTSGLNKFILQHIWSLTSQTHPGWFTPAELISALALIGLAQTEPLLSQSSQASPETLRCIINLQRLRTLSNPPVPQVTIPCRRPLTGLNALLDQSILSDFCSSHDSQPTAFTNQHRQQQPKVQGPLLDNLSVEASHSHTPSRTLDSFKSTTHSDGIDEEWAEFTSCKATIKNTLCPTVDPLDAINFVSDWSSCSRRKVVRSPDARDDEFGDFQTSDNKQHSRHSNQASIDNSGTSSSAVENSTYLRPNYNLSVDLMSDLTPLESVQHEWLRCVVQCAELLHESLEALELLTCEAEKIEFNETEEGREFFYDILEVYLVAQRVRGSAERLALLHAPLQTRFAEIRRSITKFSQYIVKEDIKRIWDAVVTASQQDVNSVSLDVLSGFVNPSSDKPLCGVCLSPIGRQQGENDPDNSSTPWPTGSVALAGRIYHTPCANLWINRVQLSLPALTVP